MKESEKTEMALRIKYIKKIAELFIEMQHEYRNNEKILDQSLFGLIHFITDILAVVTSETIRGIADDTDFPRVKMMNGYMEMLAFRSAQFFDHCDKGKK